MQASLCYNRGLHLFSTDLWTAFWDEQRGLRPLNEGSESSQRRQFT